MNVHGHTILTKLKVSSKVWDEQAAFVRGYILALEDVIKDIDDYVHRSKYALKIREMVTETLTQARATLAALEQMERNHIDHVQRPEEQ